MANEQDLQPLLDVQQNRLDQVTGDGDSIDAKALAVLGANVAIIIFVNQAALALWSYVPFVCSLLCTLFCIWPRKYYGMVDPDDAPEYLSLGREALVLQLLADTLAAIHHNNQLNRQRMVVCLVAIALTGLGFVALLFIL